MFFGYTNCPDVCPTVLADAAAAIRRMPEERKDDVELVFVTTDPDRFDPSFVGLTGDMDTIEQAADDLIVEIEPKEEQADGGYTTDHGSHVIGFDADDQGWLLWTPGTPVGDLREDYTRFLTEFPAD
ncbi:SCO family protein [Nocardiopsis gilva]|uniref:SCO family protein n=1 Tax=Nocardiopsis gilva TaxID=280236 RepID=UPI0003475281|nr:SCO family protein [Nocardiopsis gilva]